MKIRNRTASMTTTNSARNTTIMKRPTKACSTITGMIQATDRSRWRIRKKGRREMAVENGKKDEFIGKAKKAASDALNDDKTKNEGKRQETEGKVKDAAKDIKEKGKDMFNDK